MEVYDISVCYEILTRQSCFAKFKYNFHDFLFYSILLALQNLKPYRCFTKSLHRPRFLLLRVSQAKVAAVKYFNPTLLFKHLLLLWKMFFFFFFIQKIIYIPFLPTNSTTCLQISTLEKNKTLEKCLALSLSSAIFSF